jgi:hypothetical protein
MLRLAGICTRNGAMEASFVNPLSKGVASSLSPRRIWRPVTERRQRGSCFCQCDTAAVTCAIRRPPSAFVRRRSPALTHETKSPDPNPTAGTRPHNLKSQSDLAFLAPLPPTSEPQKPKPASSLRLMVTLSPRRPIGLSALRGIHVNTQLAPLKAPSTEGPPKAPRADGAVRAL